MENVVAQESSIVGSMAREITTTSVVMLRGMGLVHGKAQQPQSRGSILNGISSLNAQTVLYLGCTQTIKFGRWGVVIVEFFIADGVLLMKRCLQTGQEVLGALAHPNTSTNKLRRLDFEV